MAESSFLQKQSDHLRGLEEKAVTYSYAAYEQGEEGVKGRYKTLRRNISKHSKSLVHRLSSYVYVDSISDGEAGDTDTGGEERGSGRRAERGYLLIHGM